MPGGVGRQVVRITLQNDGFGVLVPYHPARNGWVYELPLDYTRTEYGAPLAAGKHYTVSDVVKLSFHMSGFVQFSRGGGRPIVSGYNPELDLVKGAGLRAPDPVRVSTGPLFGVQLYGLDTFDRCTAKPVELFEPGDRWYRVGMAGENDAAFCVEVFMLPNSLLGGARAADGMRTLRHRLPYNSPLWFEHEIRVVELPRLPFFLGVIVSRIPADAGLPTGYKLLGPGCGEPGVTPKCIAAQYPSPQWIDELKPTSLDMIPGGSKEVADVWDNQGGSVTRREGDRRPDGLHRHGGNALFEHALGARWDWNCRPPVSEAEKGTNSRGQRGAR